MSNQRDISLKKINGRFDRLVGWFKLHNWQFIAGAAIFMVLFEGFELLQKNEPLTDPFLLLEFLIYFAILIAVGTLIDFLIKANNAQKRTLGILKYKHEISLEFAKLENWEELKSNLVMLPTKIADVSAARLQIHNPVSYELEEAATWHAEGTPAISPHRDCQECIRNGTNTNIGSKLCMGKPDATHEKDFVDEFCIPIKYGNSLLALIQIQPKVGTKLSQEQVEIFESISPEIALALTVGQEQEILRETQTVRTALSERRTVSTFIHDQLGQNLGFLHLKLDQLSGKKSIEQNKEVRTELNRLREVANDSYEIVRDILKRLQSETFPHLTNLLREQANTISHRAGFALAFETTGKPIPLLPVIRQSIFFSFCEVLRNIEKHANATNVNVLVAWKDGLLDISISDNGKGFDPTNIQGDEHFGLQIIKERIANIKGTFTIISSTDSGTVISISVPIKSIMADSI